MVYVKRHASLPPDTLVGVFLSMTLGLGICLLVAVTKRFNIHQVEAVMFGSLLTVTDADLALLLGDRRRDRASCSRWIYNQLLLDSLDPSLGARERRAVGASRLPVRHAAHRGDRGQPQGDRRAAGRGDGRRAGGGGAQPGAHDPRAISSLEHRDRAASPASAGSFISSRLLVPSGGAVVLAMSALFFVTLALAGVRSMWRG